MQIKTLPGRVQNAAHLLTRHLRTLACGLTLAVGCVLLPAAEELEPGQLDGSFKARLSHRGRVEALIDASAGRFYVAGFFELLNGERRGSLARLSADGDLDTSFVPPPALNVNTITRLPEGELYANLGFSGVPSRIVRLAPDGRLDERFESSVDHTTILLTAQPDGKVLVATWNPAAYLVRLHPDGRPDPSFSVNVDNPIRTVTVLANGQLLIGGSFSTVSGVARGGIARLHPDGTLDASFQPVANPAAWVNCLTPLPDGRIFMAGGFGRTNLQPRRAIARLLPNGPLDPSFDPGEGIGPDDVEINAIAVQPDGRVLIGGNFARVNGAPRGGLARLNADGTLDARFVDPQLSSDDDIEVRAILLQGLDHALVGGDDPIGLVRVYLGLTGEPPRIEVPPVSQTRFAGQKVAFEAVVTGTEPLHRQWRFDGTPLAGATNSTLTLAHLTPADAGRYALALSNAFGVVVSPEAVLTVQTRSAAMTGVDPSFDPTAEGRLVGPAGGKASVTTIVLQPDGKAIVGGNFSAFDATPRSCLARLNPDRTLDPTFSIGHGADRPILAAALQTDGRILIGGTFTQVDARPRSGLARLHADGTLDLGFQADTTGPNVSCIQIDPQGRIWVGGNFTAIAGLACPNLARLNADGTVDRTFTPPPLIAGPYDYVNWVHELPNRQILVGGHFESQRAQGGLDQSLVRLHPNGTFDPEFQCDLSGMFLSTATVRPEGTIIVGGMLHSWVGGSHYFCLAELEPNGHVEREFSPDDLPAMVTSMLLQPDGKLVIGGLFEQVNQAPRSGIARLNPDGTLDTAFDPDTPSETPIPPSVLSLALQPDGRIWVGAEVVDETEAHHALTVLESHGRAVTGSQPRLSGTEGTVIALAAEPDGALLIGGYFTRYNHQPRTHLARLNWNGTLDPGFVPALSPQFWVRVVKRQPDGKVLVAGRIDPGAAGAPPSGLVRLLPDGSNDLTFRVSPGADGSCDYVRCLDLQPDGRILIGGEFHLPPRGLARLHPDGSVDPTFQPPDLPAWDEEGVHAVAVLPDGRILVGGTLSGIQGSELSALARLNPDGSIDRSFDLGVALREGTRAITALPDGKWLVSGAWTPSDDIDRAGLLRLTALGDLDATIRIRDAIPTWPIAVEPDGHLLVGGPRVVRLTPDGLRERTFVATLNPGGVVNALLVQPDGRVVIGGDFSCLNGLPANNLARLFPNAPPRVAFVERNLGPESLVRLVAQPPAGTTRYSFEDHPSWQPIDAISHGGRYDPTTGKVIFGPFADDQSRECTYRIVVPPGGAGVILFHGTATADGTTTPIPGDASLRVWPFPPPPLWIEMRWRPIRQQRVVQVWGEPNRACAILVSTDLLRWETLDTFLNPAGFAEFVEPTPGGPLRFYRAQQW